jgi:hypothetical protein
MFNYFSDNYAWSSTVAMGLMSGGQFGEMHRWLKPLRDVEPDMRACDMAWVGMVAQLKTNYRNFLRKSPLNSTQQRKQNAKTP